MLTLFRDDARSLTQYLYNVVMIIFSSRGWRSSPISVASIKRKQASSCERAAIAKREDSVSWRRRRHVANNCAGVRLKGIGIKSEESGLERRRLPLPLQLLLPAVLHVLAAF